MMEEFTNKEHDNKENETDAIVNTMNEKKHVYKIKREKNQLIIKF